MHKTVNQWTAISAFHSRNDHDHRDVTMASEAVSTIAYIGAAVGLVGGGVALFNSWKAVQWKRAELANSYLKDFNNNPELVFASRCLDFNGGRLVLPDHLRAKPYP